MTDTWESEGGPAFWDASERLSKAPRRSNMAPPAPEARYEYAIQYERLAHPGQWITFAMLGETDERNAMIQFTTDSEVPKLFHAKLVRREIKTTWEIVLDGLPAI